MTSPNTDMEFYLITNAGTLKRSKYAQEYPRHLVLAQFMTDATYASVTRHLCCQQKVILDNGAYEGALVPTEAYVNIALSLNPWCVVLPDFPNHPAKESRLAGMSAAIQFNETDIQLMYVPQGQTAVEVIDEYDWAVRELNPERFIIGIGLAYKHWGDDEEARREMVTEIMSIPEVSRFRYHILGARWEGNACFSQCNNIIGIDSYKVCRCALSDSVYPRHILSKPSHFSNLCPSDKALRENIQSFCEVYGAKI